MTVVPKTQDSSLAQQRTVTIFRLNLFIMLCCFIMFIYFQKQFHSTFIGPTFYKRLYSNNLARVLHRFSGRLQFGFLTIFTRNTMCINKLSTWCFKDTLLYFYHGPLIKRAVVNTWQFSSSFFFFSHLIAREVLLTKLRLF